MENELGEFSAGLIANNVPIKDDPLKNSHTMETIVMWLKKEKVKRIIIFFYK